MSDDEGLRVDDEALLDALRLDEQAPNELGIDPDGRNDGAYSD